MRNKARCRKTSSRRRRRACYERAEVSERKRKRQRVQKRRKPSENR
jgi:hypothetical protein